MKSYSRAFQMGKAFFLCRESESHNSSTHQLVLILRKYTDRSRWAILVHDKIYWQHTEMDTCGKKKNILYAWKQCSIPEVKSSQARGIRKKILN